MSTSGRTLLAGNNVGWDQPFYQNAQPITAYRPPVNHENNVIERVDISATSGTSTWAYGNTIKFELDRRVDSFGNLELIYIRSADTGGSTNPYFVDFEGFASIDRVEMYTDNVPGLRWTGEQLFRRCLTRDDDNKRQLIGEEQLGYKYPNERKTAAQNTATIIVDLRLPFEDFARKVPLHTFSQKLHIDVTLKSLSYCCKCDAGTPAFTISNPILRISEGMHLTDPTRLDQQSKVDSQDGLAFKMNTVEIHKREIIPTATGTFTLKLTNFKNSSVGIEFILRNQSDVDNQNTLNPWNWQKCSRYWLQENGIRISPQYEMNDLSSGTVLNNISDYSSHVEGHRIHPHGQRGMVIGYIPFVLSEMLELSDNDSFGGRYFSSYNNPELVLQFDTPTSQIMYLDVESEVNNFCIFEQGTMRPYLRV